MSGYIPVFRSIFEGSLCGQYPDTAAWLFLLALSDKYGHVDQTPKYISAVTGMPVEELLGCIERFMQPDPVSRSGIEDGRRLVLIDPKRNWGWRIVNHGKYREQARLQAKAAREVADGKNSERMRDRRRPPETAAEPLSDSYSNSIKEEEGAIAPAPAKSNGKPRKPTKTPIPDGFPDLAADPDLAAYVRKQLPDVDLATFAEAFRGKALAKGWEYANWRSALQEFARNCAPNSGHWAAGQYPKQGQAIQWQ